MTEKDIKPEREKGAPPPDYMPAIFGWMSFEDQEEHAREIVDFVKKLDKKNGKNT
ncbi:hypothetical protein [Halothermothrix orenii]|uniref:Uncharacterized protein n=1 Tax=Halothermothrix orenii (strain H 168 / OCM 544 / DSM 9562) TaxID=373903 RepID=B8CXA4_HALOH|nr:hypothetical protein [Halothermothrix orenii]ACL69923.1 hypothetical protein Hore_11730 [Halothermothrix orenii H 168]